MSDEPRASMSEYTREQRVGGRTMNFYVEYEKVLHDRTQKARECALRDWGKADSGHRDYAQGIAEGLQVAIDLLRRVAAEQKMKDGR